MSANANGPVGLGSVHEEEAATKPLNSDCNHTPCPYPWGEQHAAYSAGFDAGQRRANRVAAEAIARELLQDRANEMLGIARREAAKIGPNWLRMIEDQANAPWSA